MFFDKGLCYRCMGKLRDTTPEDVNGISFYQCEECNAAYTENEEGRIHDRWLMPITLPLYEVIYEKNPLDKLDRIVRTMWRRGPGFRNLLVEHIDEELTYPKQRLTDIHRFVHADEEQLREFLKQVKERLLNMEE